MYERFIPKAHAVAKLHQMGSHWSQLKSQGTVELTPGVYLVFRGSRTYLQDRTSTDGSGLYDLVPEDMKPSIPARIEAAQRGENYELSRYVGHAQNDDAARQAEFKARLIAV